MILDEREPYSVRRLQRRRKSATWHDLKAARHSSESKSTWLARAADGGRNEESECSLKFRV
jgi:hypothetical protein